MTLRGRPDASRRSEVLRGRGAEPGGEADATERGVMGRVSDQIRSSIGTGMRSELLMTWQRWLGAAERSDFGAMFVQESMARHVSRPC
jgi:hypothetical protein